jgi:hypothetical protein
MRFPALSVACALLATACAGPDGMRSRTPDASLASSRPARTVASCIANAWENSSPLGTPNVRMRISERGFMVAVHNPMLGFDHVMVDVEEVADGSSVTRYFKQAPNPWPQFDDAVDRCQVAR